MGGGGGAVKDLRSKAELEEAVKGAAPVIVHVWAAWCEASKQMDKVFAHLAVDFPHAHFLGLKQKCQKFLKFMLFLQFPTLSFARKIFSRKTCSELSVVWGAKNGGQRKTFSWSKDKLYKMRENNFIFSKEENIFIPPTPTIYRIFFKENNFCRLFSADKRSLHQRMTRF